MQLDLFPALVVPACCGVSFQHPSTTTLKIGSGTTFSWRSGVRNAGRKRTGAPTEGPDERHTWDLLAAHCRRRTGSGTGRPFLDKGGALLRHGGHAEK